LAIRRCRFAGPRDLLSRLLRAKRVKTRVNALRDGGQRDRLGWAIVRRPAFARFRLRHQPACKPRRFHPLPELGIGQGPPQHPRILVELAEPGVALAAEQKAQPARGMAMIDTELGGRPSLADRAEAVLRGRHEVVVGLGQAVIAPELRFRVGHRRLLGQWRAEQQLLLGLYALMA